VPETQLPVHDVAVGAPPQRVWDTLLAMIEAGVGYVEPGNPAPHGVGAILHLPFAEEDPLIETVTGFEPPRVRRYKVEGEASHLDRYEAVFVVEPAGETSQLQWFLDVDEDPSAEGAEFVAFAIELIGGFVQAVAASFEPAEAG